MTKNKYTEKQTRGLRSVATSKCLYHAKKAADGRVWSVLHNLLLRANPQLANLQMNQVTTNHRNGKEIKIWTLKNSTLWCT